MEIYFAVTNKAPPGYRERMLIQDEVSLDLAASSIFANHLAQVCLIFLIGRDPAQWDRSFKSTMLPLPQDATEYSAHYLHLLPNSS
jgi:hypothetical protein